MKSGIRAKTEQGHRSTIYDVARMAGVSAGTVSHVINRTASISPETKKRVQDAIEKLGYRRNANARALRTSDAKILGIIFHDLSSEYYAKFTAGILQSAQEAGFSVLTVDAHWSQDLLRSGVRALVERQANGLIFAGGAKDEDAYREAAEAGVPIVFGDRFVEGFPCVQFNNYDTMYRLVQALYEQGYRKFHYLGEELTFQQNLQPRYFGFRDGLRDLNVPEEDIYVTLHPGLDDEKIRKSHTFFSGRMDDFRGDPGKHVLLTSNDLFSLGAMSALISGGLRIPQDVAVFGFDNISIARYSTPSLSTVVQNPAALGMECLHFLLKKIQNPQEELENVMLEQKIALRDSCYLDAEIALRHGLLLHSDL